MLPGRSARICINRGGAAVLLGRLVFSSRARTVIPMTSDLLATVAEVLDTLASGPGGPVLPARDEVPLFAAHSAPPVADDTVPGSGWHRLTARASQVPVFPAVYRERGLLACGSWRPGNRPAAGWLGAGS
jgi:hypothetical protein